MEQFTTEKAALKIELTDLDGEASRLQQDYDDMVSWAHIYATASKEQKKMILYQLIYKVIVGRDYKIEVQFNISYRQYQQLFFGVEYTDFGEANAPKTLSEKLG